MRWGPDYWCTPRAYWTMRYADRIGSFIHEYEVVLSRFRDDSIVGRMRTAAHGGTFDFPDWASGLFGLYDRLFAATDGATDPCVGEDLIRLGYDESYSFTPAPDAAEHAGAIHGRAIWSADVERHGTTLVTRGPVALDFGACGKGYLVDLLAGMLGDGAGHPQPIQYVIDAGGDLLVHTDEPITIALEDPCRSGQRRRYGRNQPRRILRELPQPPPLV